MISKNSFLIILAGVFWGTMGLFVHALTDLFGFTSLQSSAVRLFSATLLTLVFVFIYNKKLFKIALCDLWMFICSGVFSIMCLTVFYFLAISSDTSMSVSAILLYTAPVWVMIFSCIFFKETFTARKLIALICAFLGCVLISSGSDVKVTLHGFIYGLISGLAYASYSIFGKIATKKYHPFTFTLYSFIFSAIGIVFVLILSGDICLSNVTFSPNLIIMFFLTGLFTTFLPFILYTKGLSKTEPSKASIMASFEPLSASVCGLFLGEKLSFTVILGMLGIVLAIVVLNTKSKKHS